MGNGYFDELDGLKARRKKVLGYLVVVFAKDFASAVKEGVC